MSEILTYVKSSAQLLSNMEKQPKKSTRVARVALACGEVLASGGHSLLNRLQKPNENSGPSFGRHVVSSAAVKDGNEFSWADTQMAKLREFLLTANSFVYEDFIGFMISRMLEEDKPTEFFSEPLTRPKVREIGRHVTNWAVSLKEFAAASAWPEDAVSPDFIYAEFQQWLDDEETQKLTVDGQSPKNFYLPPQTL